MNILVISNWYPNKNNVVSGIFVNEQVKALKLLGVNIIVFFPFDKSIKEGVLVEDIEEGILVYRANTDNLKNSKLSRISSIRKSLKILNKIVIKHDINLIHAHVCYVAGIISYLYNKFYKKIPYIITEHSSKVSQYSSKFYNKILFYSAYKNAEKVISVSRSLENELKSLGYIFNSKIIGNIVDTKYYTTDNEYKLYDSSLKGLFIGLMGDNEVKGIQYLLPAISNFVKKHNYNVSFTFIGDGPKKIKYEKMVKELGIANICTFKGTILKKDIPEHIMKHDFLILPSIKETFGSVLIEAMAAGKPVLTTKCGGPEEFVTDKLGIVVKSKDIESLEKGLYEMVNNYKTFDKNYIKKFAQNEFSYETIGKKIKDTYCEVLSVE
ncbi:glycosyltransferase [Clostridium botulinum]|uniref:glycosyltransferase n=1 Tax=Clostridium botulinum TaxID=1491 RepID=UPI0009475525|nr:glycosyltransferase [Clostridium botulinum]APQ97025.1 glycosyl transferases group 1 family protein [Clostridium botulinum]MBN3363610.1 glycosyltransferase family 4 protein [Clostridium botulinum]